MVVLDALAQRTGLPTSEFRRRRGLKWEQRFRTQVDVTLYKPEHNFITDMPRLKPQWLSQSEVVT